MNNIAALVLDGHSRAALETVQSLGRAGVQVDLAAENENCLAMHSRYVSQKLQQPSPNHTSDFHSWLRTQDKHRNYALIVPATEASLLSLRQLDESDPLRCKAVIPGNHALDIALDKEKTWQLARELRVPIPSSKLISNAAEIDQADPFPVVLKPTHSKVTIDGALHTLAVAVVRNEAARLEQLQKWLPLTPVQQQQYVFGRGVGVEFLFNRGQKLWHFAHERVHEYPLTGGASSYRRSIIPPPDMLRDAEKLLTVLKWHGVAMVEFKMDVRGRYWLMEINPRFWGSLALSIDAGVNFPLGLLKVARGDQPEAQPEYKSYYYTRDLRTDVDWLKCNLRADRQDPLLHTRARAYSFLELLRPMTGRESWDHFDWRDPGIARRILTLAVTDQLRPIYRKIRDRQMRQRLLRHHRSLLQRLRSQGGPKKVVFICYGNICRSPLAEKLAEQRTKGVAIESAGFHEHTGRPSPEKIMRIGNALGVDLGGHRSARVTRDSLLQADLIVAMDMENLQYLRQKFPETQERTTLLGLFATPPILTIADPFLVDEGAANHICQQVRLGVEGLSDWIACVRTASDPSELSSAALTSR
jgi:protein-tyrosine-phosphatase/predicted ATP-grasp superfamily ATP-dependent carboligase